MKALTLLIAFVLAAPAFADRYFVNIPPEKRAFNHTGNSCVYCSVTNCLRGLGMDAAADRFWRQYGSAGMADPEVSNKLRLQGVACKVLRQESELIAALKAGQPVAVTYGGAHCVTLVGLWDGKAWLVGNLTPQYPRVEPWEAFVANWQRSGGWGVTVLRPSPAASPRPLPPEE